MSVLDRANLLSEVSAYFEECNTGKGLKLSRVLKPYLKYALPVLIVIVFVQGFIG